MALIVFNVLHLTSIVRHALSNLVIEKEAFLVLVCVLVGARGQLHIPDYRRVLFCVHFKKEISRRAAGEFWLRLINILFYLDQHIVKRSL